MYYNLWEPFHTKMKNMHARPRHGYALLILSGLLVASCGQEHQQSTAPRAIPVTVGTVQATDAVYYDQYPGIVNALDEVRITPQVSGAITGIYFKDGSMVHKGEKLYSIDAEVYEANYNQAVANLEVQQSNLLKAQNDAKRYHELDQHDAIAKQQVDYADAALDAAQKQVAAAKANVSAQSSNVRFSTIYAPMTGTIGISQVKKGTAVVAGQTLLNTVSTDNPIAVDFTVDQSQIYRFSEMEQKGTNPADSVFTIAFGGEVYPYPGKIGLIDRAVDPQTGTIKTRLIFPNDHDLLKPGMNTTVRVKNTPSGKATIIPYKAVTEQLGEFFVYLVGDSNRVTQQKIHLGRQIGEDVIVTDGLTPGEKFVIQGVQNLHQGSIINDSVPPTQEAKKP